MNHHEAPNIENTPDSCSGDDISAQRRESPQTILSSYLTAKVREDKFWGTGDSVAFQETAYRGTQRTISTAGAGLVGGVAGFLLSEPYRNLVDQTGLTSGSVADIIVSIGVWFALILLGIGGAVTAADAVVNRDWSKARFLLVRAAPFLVVGGIIAGFIAQIAYQNLVDFEQVSRAYDQCFRAGDDICREALFAQIPGRAIGWGIAGMLGGIPIGLAASSPRLAQNGAVGGLIGGLIGGAAFDPLGTIFTGGTGGVARLVGVVLIGTLIGIGFSVITTARTSAFVEVLNGDSVGTQFPITDDVMLVGCANNTAITLRGDRDVKEHHFELRWDGSNASFACVGKSPMIEVDGVAASSGTIPLGSTVKVGRTELRVLGSRGPAPRSPGTAPSGGSTTMGADRGDAASDRPNVATRAINPRPQQPLQQRRSGESTGRPVTPPGRPTIPINPPDSTL